MIQIFCDSRCLGFINPEFAPAPGDVININCISYGVKSFQMFFTGDFSNSECPFDEHTPCIFVERLTPQRPE